MNFVRGLLLTVIFSGSPPSVKVQLWNTARIEVQTNLVAPSVGVALTVTI